MLARALILAIVVAAHAALFLAAWRGVDLSIDWPQPEPEPPSMQPPPPEAEGAAAGPLPADDVVAVYELPAASAGQALEQVRDALAAGTQAGNGNGYGTGGEQATVLPVRARGERGMLRAQRRGDRVRVELALAPGAQHPRNRELRAALAPAMGAPRWRRTAPMPAPRSNMAAAAAGGRVWYFHGLAPGRTHRDIVREVFAYAPATDAWQRAGEVPVPSGRLASAAAAVGETVYLAGGYTVAADGSEVSTPEVLAFDAATQAFAPVTRMPVPVDDSLLLAWRDRWLVLVSGWHDEGNVRDVQFYDTLEAQWIEGTPWPGEPVFGHGGGLVGDMLVACDGVTAVRGGDGRNRFALTDACFRGALDPDRPGHIEWTALPAHPGPPLYRAAATGTRVQGPRVLFAGGATRAYNYDGIGYDGVPAEPSAAVFSYDLQAAAWQRHAPLPVASMDHRTLVELEDGFLLAGGMQAGQRVSDAGIVFTLAPEPARGQD